MSGYRSPLLGNSYQPPADQQPNPLLRALTPPPAPSWGNAADQAWAAIQAKLEAEQKKSADMGLWTGGQAWEGGRPTVKGVADAAQQVASNFEGGIKAFHGSPHSFERFDISRIGTGEGAQAYGHGLYFAENEGVARSYRDQLRGDPAIDGKPVDWANPAEHAAAVVAGYNGDRNAAVRDLAGQVASLRNQKGWNEASDPSAAALRYLQAGHELPPVTQPPGHMYEVDINADPERMLHWDKPLSEQHPDVQQALAKVGVDVGPRWVASNEGNTFTREGARGTEATVRPIDRYGDGNVEWQATYDTLDGRGTQRFKTREEAQAWIDKAAPIEAGRGAEVYQRLRSQYSDAEVSQKLRDAGIPGIRYLDAGSRSTGEGTHNVVVFDADTINLLRKYGIAGLGIGLGAAATQGSE